MVLYQMVTVLAPQSVKNRTLSFKQKAIISENQFSFLFLIEIASVTHHCIFSFKA